MPRIPSSIKRILITTEEIQQRVKALAAQIDHDYQHVERLYLVGILKGAFIFMADLVRAIPLPLTLDFISISSYGNAYKTSGEVELVKDLRLPIHGRDVIVVEDIVDTGLTLSYLLAYLEARKPASIRVAALLSKPARRQVEVPVHYLGFEVEDAYVYGYGLDRAQFDRNLPFITSISPEAE